MKVWGFVRAMKIWGLGVFLVWGLGLWGFESFSFRVTGSEFGALWGS